MIYGNLYYFKIFDTAVRGLKQTSSTRRVIIHRYYLLKRVAALDSRRVAPAAALH